MIRGRNRAHQNDDMVLRNSMLALIRLKKPTNDKKEGRKLMGSEHAFALEEQIKEH